jgi:hypothetical protein
MGRDRQTAALNYEISTVWDMKTSSTTQKTSRFLKGPELVTGDEGRKFFRNVWDFIRDFKIFKSILHDCTILMRWAGHVARMGEETGVYRVLVGKPEGRRPLGRPRRRWMDNIRMDLHEVGCGCMDWIGLAQDRDRWRTLVSAVMNLRVA